MRTSKVIEGLPIAGIVAFSGCSVNALAHWMLGWSLNPSPWYWVAALLVEGCTAWLVWSVVDTLRMLTKSRLSKQDRRFHKAIFLAFVTLAIPSVTASVVANYVEFRGNPLLACLFPVLTIASAVGAGLPDVVRRYKKEQTEDRAAAKAARAAAKSAKAAQDAETAAEADRVAELVKETPPTVPLLTKKADRLAWMVDHGADMPSVVELRVAWDVSDRTIRRYFEELGPEYAPKLIEGERQFSVEQRAERSKAARQRWADSKYRHEHSGENSSGWQGGKSFEPYSPEFTEALKKKIRGRDGYRCALCNSSGKEVHHINYDKQDCRPENLITLCQSCHGKMNGDREKWEAKLSPIAIGREERAALAEVVG